jgi:hypothetical protein
MNSNYSTELHVSIPTLAYIKRVTGIDVLLEEGNKERAEGKIYSLTSKARDFLFINKSPQTQKIFSYLIYKKTWLEEWENYVVKYIEATFYYGDESAWTDTPKPILNAIYGSALSTREFIARTINEVKYTTEVF